MMKKLLAILLVLSMLFAISACSASKDVNQPTETPTKEETSQQADVTSDSATANEQTWENPVVLGVELTNLDLDGTLLNKYAGQTITVATAEGDMATAVGNQIKYFEEITGATVELNVFPGDSFMEKAQMDLNAGGQFDVVMMPIANIQGYAATGLVADMAPMLKDWASPNYDVDDFLTGLFNTYSRFGDQIIALPYKPDVIMNFYRTDLFADEEQQAKFKEMYGYDLVAPNVDTTLDEYLDICRFFTKKFNPDSPTTYGYCANAGTGNLRWIWQDRLCSFGGNITDTEFNTLFNNQAGIDAFDYMLKLAECAPPEWEEFAWESANAMFCSGEVAVMEQWPGLYGTTMAEGSKVSGKVFATVTAGGTPVLGGWAYAISARSDNQELAFKFCEFCTSKDGEMLKIEDTMDPCRTSNYERKEVAAYNPMYPVLLDSLNLGASLADVNVPTLTVELNEVLDLGCHKVLVGEMSGKEAVEWMDSQFNEIISDAGLK